MIRYRLACAKGHGFEAWFPSSDACDKQIKRKLVACPSCGATKVAKALMAPSVVTSERKVAARRRRQAARTEAPQESAAAPPAPQGANAMVPDAAQRAMTGPERELLRRLKEVRDKVLASSEYVGPRFAEEARRIHDAEAPERGIYGEASPTEVRELLSDGIEILPLPVLPDDHN